MPQCLLNIYMLYYDSVSGSGIDKKES